MPIKGLPVHTCALIAAWRGTPIWMRWCPEYRCECDVRGYAVNEVMPRIALWIRREKLCGFCGRQALTMFTYCEWVDALNIMNKTWESIMNEVMSRILWIRREGVHYEWGDARILWIRGERVHYEWGDALNIVNRTWVGALVRWCP